MTLAFWWGGTIAMGLLAYLLYALLHAERF
ncbi:MULTISPECIES: K(+)-transporting ATPase subunit F [Hydrocarboniphaga]|jgi:K+-transporting ATPase KdpF subunit|nr:MULTISPECIES: K(+)-transporting ATPase subunit F [Hydrocarboniphaga]MDZ4081181.1 K(+)-transporting ATPase subunit F [Hydrocarboniphaga sp.]